MEVFWIVVGAVVVIIYIMSQNRTKFSDRTVVTHQSKIKTDDGEITINRTQVLDKASTAYHQPGSQPAPQYDDSVIKQYNQQAIKNKAESAIPPPRPTINVSPTRIEPAVAKEPPRVAPITKQIQTTPDEERKKCPRCSRNLPMSKFRLSSKQPDGHTIWCGECLDAPRNTKHMKYCPKCKKRRMKTSFYQNSNRKDGLTLWCKDCMDKSK
ncbi:hypothetical protein PEC302107_36110 [Pectobacterium araliae]|uniref:hypothetical protein n=1 Tax=Pectobacterium araliae TaxID=3073862 RepID=UPI002089F418|nr:hypothetical protein PEC302107_36110 [Pectobacterium carotovorum subsp. carotovorum]